MAGKGKAAKVWRALALAVVVGYTIYAFSPTVANQFGSVQPAADRRAPVGDIKVRTLGGGEWSLASNRGKVILLNFWATWCPPCRIETPALVDLHNTYSSRGFTVAGIAMDEDPHATVPDFVRKYSIGYPIVVPTAPFPMLDHVEALPTSVLIDRAGRVARTYQGMVTERGLSDDIEALLLETVGGS